VSEKHGAGERADDAGGDVTDTDHTPPANALDPLNDLV